MPASQKETLTAPSLDVVNKNPVLNAIQWS